jgi:hypothetical protein
MKAIAVIEGDDVIYRSLSHRGLLSADGSFRSPPHDITPPPTSGELIYVPVFDDLPFQDAA